MNTHRVLLLGLMTLALEACTGEREEPAPGPAAAALRVHTTQRSAFHVVGADTLSDSARVLEIHPEDDGDALVAVFTDPGRRVTAGLAIVDRKMATPQLLWPDSASHVWWTGPHTLAFTTSTGSGTRLVVDVHAAELRIADTAATNLGPPAGEQSADSAMIRRAQAYTDSLRGQVAGRPQASALTYSVTRLVRSPDGRLAAFHTAARDANGVTTNPAWYALDRETGTITSIDQITGPAGELPARAGQWSRTGSFFYAKGRSLWEAEITRGTTTTTTP